MNAGVLQIMSIVFFLLAGVFLAVAVYLYFKLEIRMISDDLSGKLEKRQIQKMREENMRPVEHMDSRDLFEQETEETTERLSEAHGFEDGTTPLTAGRKEEEKATSLLAAEGLEFMSAFQIIRNEMEIHTEERIEA